MDLEFGLLITLIGVISVFSVLAVVALTCTALKRFFKEETDRKIKESPPNKLEENGFEEDGTQTFRIKLNGEEHEVKIADLGTLGKQLEVEPTFKVGEELEVVVNNVEYSVQVERDKRTTEEYSSVIKDYVPITKEAAIEAKQVISAPMQGTVINVPIEVGDKVKKGSIVIVLETMKMENAIESTVSGIVKEIKVSQGDSVKDGDTLVVID
jgi:biotin carboxyl carrier protein